MSKKSRLKLEGLDCAECAYKIEETLRREGFKFVSVNFATKEAIIEGDIEKAKEIISKVDPNVKVIEDHKHEHDHHDHDAHTEREALYILASLALFLVGIFLRYYYNLDTSFVFGLFVISYLIVGWRILKNAVLNIVHKNVFSEYFLITVATLGAFAIRQYPEAVGVMLFYVIGEFLQDRAVNKSRRSIKALLSLKAEYANLKVGEKIVKVSPENLKVGDIIIIKPGERVPVDGLVIEGSSTVDLSALTGESVPRAIQKGDEILSGTVNLSGLLTVKVTKELKDSTVSKILELVESASARKAKMEKFITKFARYYTPAVVGLSALIAFIPPLIFGGSLYVWTYRALVLLVISCPCALVLSIPLGYFGGVGKSAKEGILVKGSNFLDALSKATIVAFDKTGTITKGVFKVKKIETRNGFTPEEVLRFAAFAETYSNHPIANAIKEAYGKDVEKVKIDDFEEISGFGVKAKVNGTEIIVGNDRILHKFDIEHDVCHVKGTVAHVAINRKYAGYIIISDEIKEDSYIAIKELKKLGIKRVVMVTGDNKDVAHEIAQELGIDEVYAELLPEDKVAIIEDLEKECKDVEKIVFVGDGINDAPVIARADVGVAMGALGSDAAIEIADVVIMDDKPSKLATAIKLARKTRSIVWENIIMALGVKFSVIVMGIFGHVTMWGAVFADVGVALIAVFNTLRILR